MLYRQLDIDNRTISFFIAAHAASVKSDAVERALAKLGYTQAEARERDGFSLSQAGRGRDSDRATQDTSKAAWSSSV